jgi:hypothetical protein
MMTDDVLQPTRPPRPGTVPGFEAEEMQLLRTLSREGRMNELGYKLVALAAHGSLGLRDMALATEWSEVEVMRIITEFREHEAMCRRNATQERVRRHSPQSA